MKWKKKSITISIKGKPKISDYKLLEEVTQYMEIATGIEFDILNKNVTDITIFVHNSSFIEDSLSHIFTKDFLKKARSNTGLFMIYNDPLDRTSITKAVVFIHEGVIRKYRKHLFLEELTQSLGFPNDSYKYSNSIFYQGESRDTIYNSIDSAIIKVLYPD
jgi:hypothetical protein